MDYKIREEENKIIIEGVKDFDPQSIFECGQAFRWERESDGSYTTVAYNRVLNVKKEGEAIILYPTNLKDFQSIWYNYFDLGTDYGKIKEDLSQDETLRLATEYGTGIRILNQEPFETIISFIISANNQIPRIKKSVEILAKNYGAYIGEFNQKAYYGFPDAKTLSQIPVEEIRDQARVGFRDQRIVDSSAMIARGEIDLDAIFHHDTQWGEEELRKLPGVGPKVAQCVLLFAFKKGDAFPVDTWVKRVMEYFYLKEETSLGKIGKEGTRLFGPLAGYAQQYLFYYAREESIGK